MLKKSGDARLQKINWEKLASQSSTQLPQTVGYAYPRVLGLFQNSVHYFTIFAVWHSPSPRKKSISKRGARLTPTCKAGWAPASFIFACRSQSIGNRPRPRRTGRKSCFKFKVSSQQINVLCLTTVTHLLQIISDPDHCSPCSDTFTFCSTYACSLDPCPGDMNDPPPPQFSIFLSKVLLSSGSFSPLLDRHLETSTVVLSPDERTAPRESCWLDLFHQLTQTAADRHFKDSMSLSDETCQCFKTSQSLGAHKSSDAVPHSRFLLTHVERIILVMLTTLDKIDCFVARSLKDFLFSP